MLDFDDNKTWGPRLTATVGGLLTDRVLDELLTASPQCIEDACELLFSYADRTRIVDAIVRLSLPSAVSTAAANFMPGPR